MCVAVHACVPMHVCMCVCAYMPVCTCVCLCPASLRAQVSAIYFSKTSFQTLALLNFSREFWAACKTSRISSFLFHFLFISLSFSTKIDQENNGPEN